jgi:hypothetical protein
MWKRVELMDNKTLYGNFFFFFVSLLESFVIIMLSLCFHHHHHSIIVGAYCWGTDLPYGLHIRRTGYNPPRGPIAGWWVYVLLYSNYIVSIYLYFYDYQ